MQPINHKIKKIPPTEKYKNKQIIPTKLHT